MKFKPYKKYKDSRVEWLGRIPEHWQVIYSKWLFQERSIKATANDEQLTASQKYGVIPQKEFIKLENRKVVEVIIGHEILKHVEPNDFVISMRSFQGGIELCPYRGSVSSAYVPLEAKLPICYDFFKYLFKSEFYIKALQSTTNLIREGQALRYNNFIQVRLPAIALDEQQQISSFLNKETTHIDSLIKEKENFISLLKEKRQALISHVVTKGLDPTVKIKDSGVEWLGDVPEHWDVTSMKYIAELGPKKENIKGNLKCSFVPMKKLRTDSILLDEHRIVADVEGGYTFFKDEDILMAKVTPCFENKNIAVAKKLTNKIGFGSSEIYVFRMIEKNSNRYLYYRLQEDKFMSIAKSSMTGTAGLKRVPAEMINNFTIAVPSADEQKIIANSLDKKTKKIDSLVKETKTSIGLLKEHRTALISAAVTGKIDVRNFEKEVA